MGSIIDGIKIIGPKGKSPRYVAAGIIYLIVILSSGFFPYRSIWYLLFSVPVGILSFLSAVWQIRKPNSCANKFLRISASSLITLLAYRSMSYVFPHFSPYTEVLIIFSFVFVHTLQIWNMPAATFISDELYAPTTWVGMIIFRVLLVIAPFAAIGGTLIGKATASKSGFSIFTAGVLFLYLAYSFPFIGLSRYSAKGYRIPVDDGLGSEEAKLTARSSLHRGSSTSGKRISRNKKK